MNYLLLLLLTPLVVAVCLMFVKADEDDKGDDKQAHKEDEDY